MFPAPLVVSFIEKKFAASTIKRIVFANRKTIVYTIHGTSSAGLSCKEKKTIEVLKFVFFAQIFCTIHNYNLFQYHNLLSASRISKG